MVAAVETMMYAGMVPWHGIGTAIPIEATAAEAIKHAELDWSVETAPIVTDDVERTGVERWRVTRRVSDQAILGVVKKGWKPIQNREAFSIFDKVVGEGKAIYHTAGSLEGGSKVFLLAKMPGVIEIGKSKDEVERYLLLSNAHDGTRPLQMLFTPVRVVCSNTLGLALNVASSGDEVTKIAPRATITHYSEGQAREKKVKEMERVMGKAFRWYEMFGDFSNFCASKQLRSEQVQNIVHEVFPANKKKEVTPTILGHRTAVERLFVEGQGHDKIAGTAWALVNAFAEYADHHWATRGAKEAGDRSYSVWMGGAKGLKNRATKSIGEAIQ